MDEYGIARANLAFAEDLYGQLSQEDGNLFFSPFNISAALSILYSGANGRTALEIEKVLHFSSTPEVAAEAFQILGEVSLSDPNPSPFIRFWLYDHPPVADRVRFAAEYDPWGRGEPAKYVK